MEDISPDSHSPERHEQESDSERLARLSKGVLRDNGIDVKDPEVVAALDEIAEADPGMAVVLIMDLMGNSGLEPDEAFDEVVGRDNKEVIAAVRPNVSEKIAAICGVLFDDAGKDIPASEVAEIARRPPRAALGIATTLLTEHGIFTSTQHAERAIDLDGSLRAEIDERSAK